MKVFGITGLPGSGKSIISRIAKNEGIHIISMGDVVRDEALRLKCSSGEAAVKLRKKYGNNVVADRCVAEIKNYSRNNRNENTSTKIYKTYNKGKNNKKRYRKIEQDIFIIEGIRSPYEVSYFKKHFKNFKIIAIHSNPNERFNRIRRRKRSDDTQSFSKFLERDKRELKFGIGDVIATADYMLINEGPIPKFKNNVKVLITNEIKPKINKKYKGKNKNKSKKKNKNKQNRRRVKSKNKHKQYNKQRNRNKRNKQ